MQKQVVANLIEAVFARPEMYTITGSYGEVVSFLNGYYSGIAKDSSMQRETMWTSFCIWLNKKFDVSRTTQFQCLYEQYKDDSLEVLIRFYHEFKLLGIPLDDNSVL